MPVRLTPELIALIRSKHKRSVNQAIWLLAQMWNYSELISAPLIDWSKFRHCPILDGFVDWGEDFADIGSILE